jgi:hypothetical protein
MALTSVGAFLYMIIRKIKNKDELHDCVKIYMKFSQPELIRADYDTSVRSMRQIIGIRGFLRVAEVDGVIRAWLLADIRKNECIKDPVLQQCFFASDLTGTQAVKAVILLHEELIEEAKRREINCVISNGSNVDEKNVFTRILEKQGWSRIGYVATWHLDEHP